jgi:hypothetical protein
LGGGKAAPKRQDITTDQSTKKKLDKKSEKSLKYTGDLCLKIGLEENEDKTKKQVFAVTASKAIHIEDMKGMIFFFGLLGSFSFFSSSLLFFFSLPQI